MRSRRLAVCVRGSAVDSFSIRVQESMWQVEEVGVRCGGEGGGMAEGIGINQMVVVVEVN